MDIVEEKEWRLIYIVFQRCMIPVIPVCARKKTGLNILMHAVSHHREVELKSDYVVVYSNLIEDKIKKITARLLKKYPNLHNPRFYAIKLLEKDSEITSTCTVDVSDIVDKSYETEIINRKYDFIEEIIEEVL